MQKWCVRCMYRRGTHSHHRQESSLAELRLSLHLDFEGVSAVSLASVEDTQRTDELWMSAHKLLEVTGNLETSRGLVEESLHVQQDECINADLQDKINRMREKIVGRDSTAPGQPQSCCFASDSCALI